MQGAPAAEVIPPSILGCEHLGDSQCATIRRVYPGSALFRLKTGPEVLFTTGLPIWWHLRSVPELGDVVIVAEEGCKGVRRRFRGLGTEADYLAYMQRMLLGRAMTPVARSLVWRGRTEPAIAARLMKGDDFVWETNRHPGTSPFGLFFGRV